MTKVAIIACAALVIGALGYAWWFDGQSVAGRTPPRPLRHAAPFEAFADAAAGDWYGYATETDGVRTTARAWISDVGPGEVERTWLGKIGDARVPGRPERFPRHGLTIERLEGDDAAGWSIGAVDAVAEDHAAGGRTFHCTRLSYDSSDPMFPDKRTHTDLWISPEVPAGGLVEKREVQVLGTVTSTMTHTLLGFGHDGTIDWGVRP